MTRVEPDHYPRLKEQLLSTIAADDTLPPRALHVAHVIMVHFNRKDFYSRPKVCTIMAETGGLCERTVQAALRAMEQRKYFSRTLGTGRTATRYRISEAFLSAWTRGEHEAFATAARGAAECAPRTTGGAIPRTPKPPRGAAERTPSDFACTPGAQAPAPRTLEENLKKADAYASDKEGGGAAGVTPAWWRTSSDAERAVLAETIRKEAGVKPPLTPEWNDASIAAQVEEWLSAGDKSSPTMTLWHLLAHMRERHEEGATMSKAAFTILLAATMGVRPDPWDNREVKLVADACRAKMRKARAPEPAPL